MAIFWHSVYANISSSSSVPRSQWKKEWSPQSRGKRPEVSIVSVVSTVSGGLQMPIKKQMLSQEASRSCWEYWSSYSLSWSLVSVCLSVFCLSSPVPLESELKDDGWMPWNWNVTKSQTIYETRWKVKISDHATERIDWNKQNLTHFNPAIMYFLASALSPACLSILITSPHRFLQVFSNMMRGHATQEKGTEKNEKNQNNKNVLQFRKQEKHTEHTVHRAKEKR